MNNITIIDEKLQNIEGIGVKKIKLAGMQLAEIKEKRIVESKQEEVEPETSNIEMSNFSLDLDKEPFEKEMPKVENTFKEPVVAMEEPNYNNSVNTAPIINLDKFKEIKDLENTYKGRNYGKLSTPKEEVNESKSDDIEKKEVTVEDFDKELSVKSFLPETEKRKAELKIARDKHENNINQTQKELDDTRAEYAKESSIGEAIVENKKDIQAILNDMNSWKMDAFSKFKNDQRTYEFLQYTENFFGSFRKDLENQIHEEKACGDRKQALGTKEKHICEHLKSLKDQFNAYIAEEYPNLKELNEQDAIAKETYNNVKKLAHSTENTQDNLDRLKLNSEKLQDVKEDKLEAANNNFNQNIFASVRQSNMEEPQQVNNVEERKQVIDFSSFGVPTQSQEYNNNFRRVA